MGRTFSLLVVSTSLTAGVAQAAFIPLSAGSPSYSQNFNTLTTSGTATAFVQDPLVDGADGLAGWFATTTNATTIIGSAGGVNTGRVYSYGSDGDRALGTLPSGTTGDIRHGFALINTDPSQKITSFTITYTGEQWRNGGPIDSASAAINVNNQVVNSWAIFGTGSPNGPSSGSATLNLAGIFSSTLATFNSPVDGGLPAGALDGNLAANRVAGITDTVTLDVLPGQEL